jgi:hypothetical protein
VFELYDPVRADPIEVQPKGKRLVKVICAWRGGKPNGSGIGASINLTDPASGAEVLENYSGEVVDNIGYPDDPAPLVTDPPLMDEEQFGTTVDYLRAFNAIYAEGIADHHDRLLRAHLAAHKYATTWEKLAKDVGYPTGSTVRLQYGKFARQLARHLKLTDKPRDPSGEEWWLWVLVRWAENSDPENGHTVFVLRRPVIEALQMLGTAIPKKNMRYWWVNQNQTFKAEFSGGYIWSPKRNKNDARNQFYENMRIVSPGDMIFSFRDTMIVAIGRATSFCYDAPKPEEFGTIGANWELNGWRIDVQYKMIESPIQPKSHIDRIRPLLPEKYSPLRESGDGLQSVYLAELPNAMADMLATILEEAGNIIDTNASTPTEAGHRDQVIAKVEAFLESSIESSPLIESTEKEQLIKARRGQGRFRMNVQKYEDACRVSGVVADQFLIASHIKPWRVASNPERLDGQNGLLLSPNIDFLFDRGFISFADDGALLVSSVADSACLRGLGVPVDGHVNVGTFTPKQREYLSYHRHNVFLGSGSELS